MEKGREREGVYPSEQKCFRAELFGFNRVEVLTYIERISAANAEKARALNATIVALQRELSTAQQNSTSLLARTQEVCEELSQEKRRAESAVARAEELSRDVRNAQDDAAAYKSRLFAQEQENETLQKDNQRLTAKIDSLTQELTAQAARRQQEQDWESDVAARTKQSLERARTQAQDLLRQAQQEAGETRQRADADAARIRLEAKNDAARAQVRLAHSANTIAATVAALKAHLNTVDQEIRNASGDLQRATDGVAAALEGAERELELLGAQVKAFPRARDDVSRTSEDAFGAAEGASGRTAAHRASAQGREMPLPCAPAQSREQAASQQGFKAERAASPAIEKDQPFDEARYCEALERVRQEEAAEARYYEALARDDWRAARSRVRPPREDDGYAEPLYRRDAAFYRESLLRQEEERYQAALHRREEDLLYQEALRRREQAVRRQEEETRRRAQALREEEARRQEEARKQEEERRLQEEEARYQEALRRIEEKERALAQEQERARLQAEAEAAAQAEAQARRTARLAAEQVAQAAAFAQMAQTPIAPSAQDGQAVQAAAAVPPMTRNFDRPVGKLHAPTARPFDPFDGSMPHTPPYPTAPPAAQGWDVPPAPPAANAAQPMPTYVPRPTPVAPVASFSQPYTLPTAAWSAGDMQPAGQYAGAAAQPSDARQSNPAQDAQQNIWKRQEPQTTPSDAPGTPVKGVAAPASATLPAQMGSAEVLQGASCACPPQSAPSVPSCAPASPQIMAGNGLAAAQSAAAAVGTACATVPQMSRSAFGYEPPVIIPYNAPIPTMGAAQTAAPGQSDASAGLPHSEQANEAAAPLYAAGTFAAAPGYAAQPSTASALSDALLEGLDDLLGT